jgi:type 2 lantibiotic biosynthesis protein LanM
MDVFFERLIIRAATIDERLSDEFEPLRGQKADADLAARRLGAWCRACASGDWQLFARRLRRDGLELSDVLSRLATVRRKASAKAPAWIKDAIWIEAALQSTANAKTRTTLASVTPCAFQHLFLALIEKADAKLWSEIDARISPNFELSARTGLRVSLLEELSGLCTPALYELFKRARDAAVPPSGSAAPQRTADSARYGQFVADMIGGGFRRLFEEKPVLLRLIATIVRQWIDTSRELILRLDADLVAIRSEFVRARADSPVSQIQGNLSDPHNGGRSVRIVIFADGARIVYKPKDLRLDATWHALIERMNACDPPVVLRAARTLVREGYGWSEFIEHTGCADEDGCERFFRRAGAWLALFHCFAAADMHEENIIAAGDHQVPIDLEMILQASADERKSQEPEGQAFDAAMEIVSNSVMAVGLLPAYGRTVENNVFAIGGMNEAWNTEIRLGWNNINTDAMRPAKVAEVGKTIPNLPHFDGCYAKFGDYLDNFVSGFEDYARFLQRQRDAAKLARELDSFAGVPVRKILRPTRFYGMLVQRLRNHRTMDDGAAWSAQADFVARLADWEMDMDPLWPLHRVERSALMTLNVPHFVSLADGDDIRDANGNFVRTAATPGLARARERLRNLAEQEIGWQVEVIRQNTYALSRSAGLRMRRVEPKEFSLPAAADKSMERIFIPEADRIAEELCSHAIRRGPGAAWIGLDWLAHSEFLQLVCLGPDLYNGVSGIGVFLAAHAAVRECKASAELALASVAYVRKTLKGRNAARVARFLGIGGATGLGSIVYALAVIAKCLRDTGVRADALAAAELLNDDLIAADMHLDVMAGSAGAILSLLRLYRDTRSSDALERATKCGQHLIEQDQRGAGRAVRSGQDLARQVLNGMSHGAAGVAYALSALAAATGREDFTRVAAECIAFENASYNAERSNWPDLRTPAEPAWLSQWCHGAAGIGLARIAMPRRNGTNDGVLMTDVRNALAGAERAWPSHVDTLCCGTLGNIEFFSEAGKTLGRGDLRDLAARRLLAVVKNAALSGDYRWTAGRRQFNLGLFRGIAGVGYTLLRQLDGSLPNVTIWE